jgi:hypothetical protein
MNIPSTPIRKLTTPIQVNLEEQPQSMALDMVDATNGNQVIFQKLMTNFFYAQGN